MPRVRHYSGAFSHPSFGPDEIPIEVTLYGSTGGMWTTMDQGEEINVQRDGKNIVMTDKSGTTTMDGHEVVGGMVIGAVIQNGEVGGRFRLQPCPKSRMRTAVVTRTCVQRQLHIPLVTRWRAVGTPAKLSVQYAGEAGWRTTCQTA